MGPRPWFLSPSRWKKHCYFEKDDWQHSFGNVGRTGNFTGLTIADLRKLNPPDEFETELRIMAEVCGYFQVAYKGFRSDLLQLYNSSQYRTNAHSPEKSLILFQNWLISHLSKLSQKNLQPSLYKEVWLGQVLMRLLGLPNCWLKTPKFRSAGKGLLSQKTWLEKSPTGIVWTLAYKGFATWTGLMQGKSTARSAVYSIVWVVCF